MNKFKLFRTGSLVLGLWLLITAMYIVFVGFEKPDCCAVENEGYKIYTFIQWFVDYKLDSSIEVCQCAIKDLSETFYIIPMDLFFSSFVFWGIFVYLQFGKKWIPDQVGNDTVL